MTEPFYLYRVIDYYATGEGKTIYLQVSRNNSPSYPEDYFKKRWEQFVEHEYYLQGTEELPEREFLDKYTRFIPYVIANMIQNKGLSIWETHLHFNYS
jgi:hypothetical protein